MSGKGTTDIIFILRQIQKMHLAMKKKLYYAFIDLEKAFDRVPREMVIWALRKQGVDEPLLLCCLSTPMTLASGGSPIFPLVVHQPTSPSLWPAVHSLRK